MPQYLGRDNLFQHTNTLGRRSKCMKQTRAWWRKVAMDRNGRQDKLVIPLVYTQNTTRGHHPRVAGESLAFKQIKIVLLFGVGGWSVSGWSGEGALSCPLEHHVNNNNTWSRWGGGHRGRCLGDVQTTWTSSQPARHKLHRQGGGPTV